MSIAELIEHDLLSAMKAKEVSKVSTLRMVKAALDNCKIERKKERLDDQEVIAVLQRQAKQRMESIESFQKAGRTDLVEKEKNEFAILQAYLPKPLTDEELKALVQKAITAAGAKTKADLGRVMKELMPSVQGKADGKRVNGVVLQLLG